MAVLLALFVKGCCKRHHLDEKIILMVERRRSARSRRSGSSVAGQRTTRVWSSHDVVDRELESLEGEVKTNPMLSPTQSAAMAQGAREGAGATKTTEVFEEKDEHEILIDPATMRKYSWNTKTGETVWIDEEEAEAEEEEDDDTEILTDPVSGRKYVHHIPSGNTTWLDG